MQDDKLDTILSVCYDPIYGKLIADYNHNKNTVASYLKREGISDVLKYDNIVQYIIQIAQINIEIDRLQNELNNFE